MHCRRYVSRSSSVCARSGVIELEIACTTSLEHNIGLGEQDWPGQSDPTPELDDGYFKLVVVGIIKEYNRPWHRTHACASSS